MLLGKLFVSISVRLTIDREDPAPKVTFRKLFFRFKKISSNEKDIVDGHFQVFWVSFMEIKCCRKNELGSSASPTCRDKLSEFSLAKQGKGKTRHFWGSEMFLYFIIPNKMSFSLFFFYFFIVHLSLVLFKCDWTLQIP